MSVVKINAIDVPEGMGEQIEARFAVRAHEVEKMPGFEGFELLRPVAGEQRYFVYTRWVDEASFRAWVESSAFTRGHAQASQDHGAQKPVARGADLLEFEVVQKVDAPPA